MQRIAKVHRFRQRLGDGIQYQELPVAAPDFEFCLLALGNIEQETLVRYHVAGGIADRDGRLQHGAYFAVLAPHFEFEIGYLTVLLQEPFEPFAIGAFGIERGRNVDPHQLLAVLIAGHSKKRIVEIQEAPLGRGDKHAFLNTGDERTVFFLRAFAIGDVLQDVDGSKLQSTWIGKRGIGGQEIAGQPRIGLVAFPADSLAVRATLVGSILHREEFHDASACKSAPLAPQELAEPLIAAQNASRAIVDQDRVANGIEGVFPLTLHGSDLFKQAHVLKGQAEQVRDVDKVGKLVWVKPFLARRTDGDDSQWPLLAGKRQSDERFQSGFVDPPSSNGIPLLVGLQELALSLHHLLRPGLHRREFGMASQEDWSNHTDARATSCAEFPSPSFSRTMPCVAARLSTRCDRTWSITSWTERVCVLAAVKSVRRRILSFSSSLRVRAPSRTTTTMAIPKATPRRWSNATRNRKSGLSSQSGRSSPCTPLNRNIPARSCAPWLWRANSDLHIIQPASRQTTVSKMAVCQCSEATCCGPLRSI